MATCLVRWQPIFRTASITMLRKERCTFQITCSVIFCKISDSTGWVLVISRKNLKRQMWELCRETVWTSISLNMLWPITGIRAFVKKLAKMKRPRNASVSSTSVIANLSLLKTLSLCWLSICLSHLRTKMSWTSSLSVTSQDQATWLWTTSRFCTFLEQWWWQAS